MSESNTPQHFHVAGLVPTGPKLVTSRFDVADGYTYDGYVRTGGYASLRRALTQMTPEQVHAEVKTSEMQGRGGAGFPTGTKWGFLPPDVFPRYLVVNGDESEPGTYKDRLLMELDPHQLIEGMLIACYAFKGAQAFLYVRGEMALAQERLATAINEVYERNLAGKNILGTDFSVDITLTWGAGAYIVGEETGLIESLEGERGMPRLKPPYFPASKGLYMQPTIVNNVESLSNLPWMLQEGGEAFHDLGAPTSTGMRMFSVSGHVNNPGVFEVPNGVTTFRMLMEAPEYCGGIREGRKVKAFIPGGASAMWFYEEHLDLPLDKPTVDKAGSMLGSGAIVVMDETADMVKACWRIVRFFAHESCGKCTPCREGTTWLERILARILEGDGRPEDLDMLMDISESISPGIAWPPRQTTICPLGPSAVSPIASALQRFRGEFEHYIVHGRPMDGIEYHGRPVHVDAPETPPKSTLSITVDGRPHEAQPGQLVIDACEDAGTYVPRFCYHPRMEPVGMCRQCLVEVEGPRGPMLVVSCMTPVAEGQVVHTETATVKRAQEGVLELLLANHPLDCPVCDKGGECPLQDQAFSHGPGESRFIEEKRHYEKPIAISELVYLDRERCILCDRCTRFADEVAGDPLIHFTHRGNNTQVLTFPDEPFSSYFSGNTVQICPVGALTATPYRFKARPWDLEQVESTCTTCSVGCRTVVQSSRDELLRYQGYDSDAVNWGWMCDRGRFNFEAPNSGLRLANPAVRDGAQLLETSWSAALDEAAALLRNALDTDGPAGIGIIGGARGTNEDAFAWAKLAREVLGTANVDAQLGDGLPAEVLGLPRATIAEAAAATTIVVLGVDLKEELPVLFLRVRDAAQKRRSRVVEIAPRATGLSPYTWRQVPHRAGEQVAAIDNFLADGDVKEQLGKGNVVVIAGRGSVAESPAFTLDALAALLAAVPGAKVLPALRRGNVVGAMQVGLTPGEGGNDTAAILTDAAEGRLACLVLLGADPLGDFPDADLAKRALAGARSIIAVDTFVTASSQHADVVLAAAAYGEKRGTTTNLEGRVTPVAQKVTVAGTSRPDWMVAAELADRLGRDLGFGDVSDVTDAIAAEIPAYAGAGHAAVHAARDGVLAVPAATASLPSTPTTPPTASGYDFRLSVGRKLYDQAVGTQLSPSLAGLAAGASLHLHPLDLARLGASDGTQLKLTSPKASTILPATADLGVPRSAAWIELNQSNVSAAELVDANADVIDISVESFSTDGGQGGGA